MASSSFSRTALPALAALVAGASFGINGTFSQIVAAQGFALQHIAIAQFLCGTMILGVASFIKRESLPGWRDIGRLMIIGALQAASCLSYYLAIDNLSVGQAVAIQFQYVWIAVAIQNIIERTLPSKWVIISTVAIIFGTLLGSGLVDEALTGQLSSISLLGIGFACACAVFYAFFIYFNGRFATSQPTTSRTLLVAAGAAVVTSLVSPDFYLGSCDVIALAPYGLLMGILATIIPCSCLAISGKHLPGGVVAILTSAELPAAVVSGCILLGEPISILRVIGIALIIGSIALSQVDELTKSHDVGNDTDSKRNDDAVDIEQ